jgi:hypothetical protein
VIPGTSTGYIKQMAFRVVHLFKVRIVPDSFDPLLSRLAFAK